MSWGLQLKAFPSRPNMKVLLARRRMLWHELVTQQSSNQKPSSHFWTQPNTARGTCAGAEWCGCWFSQKNFPSWILETLPVQQNQSYLHCRAFTVHWLTFEIFWHGTYWWPLHGRDAASCSFWHFLTDFRRPRRPRSHLSQLGLSIRSRWSHGHQMSWYKIIYIIIYINIYVYIYYIYTCIYIHIYTY